MLTPVDILNARILIVDDLAANVTLLEQILHGAGYQAVSSTMNPREVCALHRQHPYDLILLDLQMPGMDGFEVMEGLKQIEPGSYLPILVITAQPDHKLRALKAGAKDFLRTPFDLAEVLVRAHNMIEVHLLHRNETALNLTRLEYAQRIAGLGDWEYDFVGNRLRWSEEVYRILGLTRQDSPPDSASFYRQVHPEDLAYVHAQKQAAAKGRRVDFEHRIIRADGEVRHIHQITGMILDDRGHPALESGTIQDITDRKLADATLRRSEERFAGAFEHAPSGVALVAPDGRWLKVNRALCKLVGYSEAELLTRTFQDITHPEDLAAELDNVRQLLTGEIRSYQMEKRYIKADGQLVTVLLDASLVRDGSGRPSFFISHIQDITARKLAEVALRQEQALLSSLMTTIPDHIYIKNRQSRFIRINCSMAQRAGLPDPGLAIGKSDLDFFTAEHAEPAYQQEQRIMATGTPMISFEEKKTWADGLITWASSTKVPLRNPAGEIVGLIGVSRDITERRESMEALRESNEKFHQLADNITDTFWIRSPDMNHVHYVSPAFEKIWGRSVASLQANPQEWIDFILTEDRARVQAAFGALTDGRSTLEIEYRIVRPSGEIRWVHVRGFQVRNATDQLIRHIGIVTDITERKQADNALRESEQRFKALFEQAAVGVAQVEAATGRFVQVNQRFCDFTGRSRQELEQLTFSANTHPQDRGHDQELTEQLKAGAIREYSREKRYLRPDGAEVWVNLTVSAMWAPGEAPGLCIAIVQDITARKQVEEHLLQAQKIEAIGQFSGGVAHDFNNILAAISGYTELARMQLEGNPVVREHLGAVIKAANRAADLVRQILTFSRQQPQTRVVLLLQPVVVESMKLMRATIPSTVEIEALIAADAPTVLANANQVHQVLMNLAINGWHALKNTPGRLQVKLEKVAVDAAFAAAKPGLRPGTYARLSVSDTGCGMDPATLRRIFEPFFTTKPVGEGTGLGLAVVHGIMDSHDGAVTVHSQPGEGTSFRLYFPEYVGEATPGRSEVGPPPRGQGECVLVVDDEEMLAELGANLLTRLGYAAESTTTSAQALELVRADPSRFALVLTDQTMPGMTGLQLASQLRDIRPNLPILLMSGYNLSLTTDRVGASGIGNILQKPFTLHSLGTAVHATLAGKSLPSHGSNSPY